MKLSRQYRYLFPGGDVGLSRLEELVRFLEMRPMSHYNDSVSNGEVTTTIDALFKKLSSLDTIHRNDPYELTITVESPITLDEDTHILQIIDGEI